MCTGGVTQLGVLNSVNTLTMTCARVTTNILAEQPVGTPNPALYEIEVRQTTNVDTENMATGVLAGLNTYYDYTVDFKVDGETVPELSGEMKHTGTPDPAAFPLSMIDLRLFSFTNNVYPDGATPGPTNEVFVPGAPQDIELNRAKGGNFIEFLLIDGSDTYEVTTEAEPLDIVGGTRSCFPKAATALSTGNAAVNCAFYAGDADGAFDFRFFISALPAASSTGMSSFDIDIASNGVVIPGGPVLAANSEESAVFLTLLMRADSGDGPIATSVLTPAFLLKVSFTSNTEDVTVDATGGGAGGCVHSNAFAGTGAQNYNVLIYCADYNVGDYVFTAGVATTAITGATFEFFYQGVLQSNLSGTGDIPVIGTPRTITFTAPATEGDPLELTGANTEFVNPPF